MDNVFEFRDQLVDEYSNFSRSFTRIAASDIRQEVECQYDAGRYWPEPLIQINPNYQRKGTVQQMAKDGLLHKDCAEIFQTGKTEANRQPLHLYAHQMEALAKGQARQSYVVTTGTGSGKSLSFFLPVIDRILKAKQIDSTPRTRAIVIYPMNALANSQLEELEKFLYGFPDDEKPFTVARYTGQEKTAEREAIANNPPDILLTNFMMLELILTRYEDTDRRVVEHCHGLDFLILDELHTYRGRQGADVALLVRRLRERLQATELVCIGTSATMSSAGTQADRNKTVAVVASKLFGTKITEHDVIGETLERVTDPSKDVAAIRARLKAQLGKEAFFWESFDEFRNDPFAIWVELHLGIELSAHEAPRRAKPVTLEAASKQLALDAECGEALAREALQRFLIAAHSVKTDQGRAPFAFKLHQFISGPGKVHTTLEPAGSRQITLDAQRYAPGRQSESVLLYPAHFCRDCGQEYHPVWRSEQGRVQYSPREIDDITADDNDDVRFGFLCAKNDAQLYKGQLEDLPESWLDLTRAEPKVKSTYKKAMPVPTQVDPQGLEGRGEQYWYIPGKFRFCLNCAILHEAHGKDMNRLASLSGEGRSSATTVLTLGALRQLFSMQDLPEGLPDPRKLLGFSDNRQDAALQAGHFNDFVFLLTLRAGLIGALQKNQGLLTEEHLADSVFKALGFGSVDPAMLAEYLRTPKLMGLARQEAQRTLRFIIGYRLLRDLRRGWRFNNPNLDQLNLLAVRYRGLDEFCNEAPLFEDRGSVLRKLHPENRAALYQIVFDEMRRGLCLETRYLDPVEQDKARTSAFSYLHERWAFAADEKLETARYLIFDKRPEYRGKPRTDLLSGGPRSRLLKQVKMAEVWKQTAFAGQVHEWKEVDWAELIESMLQAASYYGYIHKHSIDSKLVGWRLNAAAMDWCLIADENDTGRVNAFFRHLYLNVAKLLEQPGHPLFDFEAQEHTAQVEPARRQLLEQRFRFTEKDRNDWDENPAHEAPLERLPVMFCSPTMELGVDISALNTVYLRNVPPTPANYAQRSGRAGRSGQQALVVTYCAALSPHDQWFFHHASDMVHGIVKPPTLDLANRDLVESHLHAVWLSCAEVGLDTSIAPLLELEEPGKPVKQALHERLADRAVLERARRSALDVVTQLSVELKDSSWFSEDYVNHVIDAAPLAFSAALERWRALFDATRKQMEMADQIVKSHTATHAERNNAGRRYGDAARQFAVLLKTGNTQGSDFYTYRYLASQGFLPGYNFPRLPLMAWIPARSGQGASGKDDEGSMVSRPRFLALSEFGPRSLIYHQGRMYRVIRAKLNVGSTDHVSGSSQLSTIASRICSQCGYGHLGEPDEGEPLVDRCENCDALLTDNDWVRELYRIDTVETVPVERISINDEDRQRQGFELQTTFRFLPGADGTIQKSHAEVRQGDDLLAGLVYTPAARLWRINRGWRRRKDKNQLGFYINPITGTWSKKDDPNANEGDTAVDEPLLDKVSNQRIVPFVEDHRNLLILTPLGELSLEVMATLQAAIKRGIEMTFQIEESELVAEPLPTLDERKSLMFYESAEGGAGVLTRLASEPQSLAEVASAALSLMHFNKPEGHWTFEALEGLEQKHGDLSICEAGCYQCLLSYFNQPDHDYINRRNDEVLKLLVALANSKVKLSDHAATLLQEAANLKPVPGTSSMLQEWLHALDKRNLRQPDALNVSVGQGAAIAAAQYKASRALVFIDPVTADINSMLADKGWQILDFSDQNQWPILFEEHTEVFGKHKSTQ
ncbi:MULTISPECIES: DEAD/DEAH box helicase [unclassified Halomonas]|uniref:DEAD/DEAH box helicase n=1 Tax=unclassified Halomonas TaxID=2609666 RepID=UPI0007D9DA3C|nr:MULTISPECIES: DEAD/DEAH box helicase [unclassified Halomonas]MBT2788022.1 DEAD/DEAH box helicase [Halomonas sp. ISL-106]MBT2795771.1 DEAD/DEAH box helicase [Halomonas sp. ISL-104]OAL61064.1 DEAD/DEAH box helicase [Halomonas sp. ALS9]